MLHRKPTTIKKVLTILAPILFICIGTLAVILYGRGYRPDFGNNQFKPTGLISLASDPKGAQVHLNDKLETATDNTLNVEPGWYKINITKEGYIPWQKNVRVQGEIVTNTDAFLFPLNPSLSPLTNTGVEHVVLSPDGTKLAYILPKINTNIISTKTGLWIYELVERPLGLNRDPRQVGISDTAFDFSNTDIVWSPDSTQIMATKDRSTRLYTVSRLNDFRDISNQIPAIAAEWELARQTKEVQKLAAFKKEIVDVLVSSTRNLSFSPDETKILYEATQSAKLPLAIDPPLIGTNSTEEKRDLEKGKYYVYDSREDKNFFVMDSSELPLPIQSPSPSATSKTQAVKSKETEILDEEFEISNKQMPVSWFPTSRHLVLTLPGKIDIMEYDRTNWVTVYSGPFINGFFAPWPNGSRIIILTNLNSGISTLPNLYTVNLR